MKVFELIFLLVSASCFLVYEKIPLNTYVAKVRKELKEISALHGLEQKKFGTFETTIDSIKYSLSSVKSKAVFFNTNMLSQFVNTQPSLTLFLQWNAKDGDTNYLSPYHSIYSAYISKESNSNSLKSELYEIEFELETSVFKFAKTWEFNSEDNFYTSSGSIDNTYISFKAKCLDAKCPFNNDILLDVINAFLSDKKSDMNDAFTVNGAEAYYKSLPFEQLIQKVYTQTSTNFANENNIDLTLESRPEYSTTNSDFIFKRKGKLNDLDIEGSTTFDDTSSYQKFNINQSLIKNLISHNLFNILYEQSNNPSPKYKLTVSYLKQLVDVSSEYDDSDELQVLAEMSRIDFNNEDLSGTVDFNVNVVSRRHLETLFNFTFNMNFKFTPTLFQNGLNFVLLAKHLSVENINSTKYTIKDKNLLKSWIDNTYLVALGNSEYNLLSLSFDLSYYFNSNKLSYEFNNDYLSIIKQ